MDLLYLTIPLDSSSSYNNRTKYIPFFHKGRFAMHLGGGKLEPYTICGQSHQRRNALTGTLTR